MDLSHWRNLNDNIKFEPTKKQYFNRYLWRLVYAIDGVHMVSDKYIIDILDYVHEHRQQEIQDKKYKRDMGYDYNGYSYQYRRSSFLGIDEVLIDRIRTLTKTFKDMAKFRFENNTMQVYAETEADLKRIAEAICAPDYITTITSPKPGTEDALRNGAVYMNKIDYKFKIILRDGNYDRNTKQSVLEQLKHRDDVKIPANLERELKKKYPALWGAYFYTNDDSIVTILSLISPGIVGKIHPIDQLQ